MALLDGDSACLIGPESLGPVDLEKDGERAEVLGESVNLDLEELLSICEDSVSVCALEAKYCLHASTRQSIQSLFILQR